MNALALRACAALCFLGVWGATVCAEPDATFNATVDRVEIGKDETLTLRLEAHVEGAQAEVGSPEYSAPDFEELNSYQERRVESFYENGNFGIRSIHRVTKVLKPLKQGSTAIQNIQIQVNGKTLKANPIQIAIGPGGAATPPPQSYGSNLGLRGAGKRGVLRPFFVRTEISKDPLTKSEQLIVSYYLYRSVRTFNIEVVKYPVLSGFLREDLDLPVQRGRLDSEGVILDGREYQRSLIARYAAYPLAEGTLDIDSMTVRANYYLEDTGNPNLNSDDPFARFFQKLTPQMSTQTSDPVKVHVMAIPDEGKPPSFTGGVGDFSLVAAVDRTEVDGGSAVQLTIKVEGRGNVSGIKAPDLELPQSIELFESKSRAKSGVGGVGEMYFEMVLIPREKGEFTIPPIEMGFFEPVSRKYLVRKTEPILIRVLSDSPEREKSQTQAKKEIKKSEDIDQKIRGFMPREVGTKQFLGLPWWRWMYWLSSAALGFFAVFVIWDQLARRMRKQKLSHPGKPLSADWKKLEKELAATLARPRRDEQVLAFERLSGVLLGEVERKTGLPARSSPRREWGARLVDSGRVSTQWWSQMDQLLEELEAARYSGAPFREDLMSRLRQGQELLGQVK